MKARGFPVSYGQFEEKPILHTQNDTLQDAVAPNFHNPKDCYTNAKCRDPKGDGFLGQGLRSTSQLFFGFPGQASAVLNFSGEEAVARDVCEARCDQASECLLLEGEGKDSQLRMCYTHVCVYMCTLREISG